MRTIVKFCLYILPVMLLLNLNKVQAQNTEALLSAIEKEVERNKTNLLIGNLQRSFFVSYAVVENKTLNISASLGALIQSSENVNRRGFPNLLVGSYERNNIGYVDFNSFYGMRPYSSPIPLDNMESGITTVVWADLDKQYKKAAEAYEAKVAVISQQNLKEEDLNLPDFEKKAPVNLIMQPTNMYMDKAYWENYARKASEVLSKYPDIIRSRVNVGLKNTMTYYYNTEQTRYAVPSTYYKVHLATTVLTDDGQEIMDDIYIEYPSFEEMPDLKSFTEICDSFAAHMMELRNAPLIDEAYTGPVLFEKMAVAEALQNHFLWNSLIAKKKKTGNEEVRNQMGGELAGNNLEEMTNKKIMSRSLSVISLSGSESYEGKKLNGYFPIDAEGVVPAKELTLVENGVLRNMLNRRIPTRKNPNSNGHARFDESSLELKTVPGNILLASREACSNDELKKRLLAAAKEEDLEYAYIIRRLRGNSILSLYRVYVADGKEELVRGAEFSDFSMKSFKRVLGASNTNYFYNMAPSGPISTLVVPEGLLFEELELAKNNNIQFKTPFIVAQPNK